MKLLGAVWKELLLLLRDKAGIVILFVMPTALVMITTLVQEDALRAVQGGQTRALLAVADEGRFGREVAAGLAGSGAFELVRELRGRPVTEAVIREELRRGAYVIGIVVPAGVTARVAAGADRLLARMLPAGLGPGASGAAGPPGEIRAYFDPTVRIPFRRAVVNALERLAQGIEVRVMMEKIEGYMNDAMGRPKSGSSWETESRVGVREIFTGEEKDRVFPSSVQQNVPAWSLFAMFLISVPLSGSIIRERDGGTLVRLRTLPVTPGTILAAKVVVYAAVCLLQFLFMLAIGTQVLPRLGTSQLAMGTHHGAIAVAALAAALAGTGFGIMMGTINRTTEQSSVFCSTTVVIAAAIGGVMVPSFLMPPTMRALSAYSPLHWGLNAFLELFLRGGTLTTILPDVAKLLAFAAATLGIAVLIFLRRE